MIVSEKKGLSGIESLKFKKYFFKKWSSLVIKDFEKDVKEFEEKNIFDQVYINSYWHKFIDHIVSHIERVENHDTQENLQAQFETICMVHPELAGENEMEVNLQNRFEWLKKRIVLQYEKDVKNTIDFHKVKSSLLSCLILFISPP